MNIIFAILVGYAFALATSWVARIPKVERVITIVDPIIMMHFVGPAFIALFLKWRKGSATHAFFSGFLCFWLLGSPTSFSDVLMACPKLLGAALWWGSIPALFLWIDKRENPDEISPGQPGAKDLAAR